jgi:hypothetical protein
MAHHNAFAVLLAKQLGNIRVAPKALPVQAPVVKDLVVPQEVVQAVQTVAVATQNDTKVVEVTFKDGSKKAVGVEATEDLEAKVEALAKAIKELQDQAAQVAQRLEAIEKVI